MEWLLETVMSGIHADDKQTAVKELIKRLKKAYKSSHIHIEAVCKG